MLDRIQDLLKLKNLPPILLMYGGEQFNLEENFNLLINSLKDRGVLEFDIDLLDANDVTLEILADKCLTYPFVSPFRVVAVRHFELLMNDKAFKKGGEKHIFGKYIMNPQPSTFLIISADLEKIDGLSSALKNKKTSAKAQKIIESAKFPLKYIIENHEWIEFPTINESEYFNWVSERVNTYKKTIDEESSELLVMQTASSLRTLANEIEKLIFYIQDRKKITTADVAAVTGISRVNNVFELQKAVGKKNLSKSLEILNNILANERQEILILTILTRYFITLWKLIEEKGKSTNQYKLASAIGVNPFFIKEYLNSLNYYKDEEIDNAFIYLAETDEKLKSTSTNSLYLLQKMLINIMQA